MKRLLSTVESVNEAMKYLKKHGIICKPDMIDNKLRILHYIETQGNK